MENEFGIGPFRNFDAIYYKELSFDETSHASWFRSQSHSKMPGVKSEFNDYLTVGHYCAYLSLKDFNKYWADQQALQTFLKCGYKVYLIYVKECYVSENQAIYLPKDILEKQEINPEIFKQKAA